MAVLSDVSVKKLLIALTSEVHGNEVATALNLATAQAAQDLVCLPVLITATSTSTTVDFGSLAIGDKVVHIAATAGNAAFFTVAAVGTLPAAAVVGDLYIVLRTFVAPAATTSTF